MHALVVNVFEVNAGLTRNVPPYLLLSAKGIVPTLGWTNGQLIPAVYIVEPPDGVWDFYLMAEKPTGIVGEQLSEVGANLTIALPKWCKGIRVHASNNKVEHMLSDSSTESELTHIDISYGAAYRDPGDAWPWVVNPDMLRVAKSNRETLMNNLINKDKDNLSVNSLTGRTLRVVHPGQFGDLMLHPNRVTFYLNENGEIESWLPF